jgi:hypothetical protein
MSVRLVVLELKHGDGYEQLKMSYFHVHCEKSE